MDIAFQGRCILGYDGAAQEYTMVRIDVLGTKMLTSRGAADSSGKVITFHGEYVHPLSGATVKTRSVFNIDRKNPVLEIYETSADGQEFKSQVISYKRKRRTAA